MQFRSAIPIFRSFDEPKARAFYVDYLGFSWDREHRFEETAPLYAFLSLGAFKLHLSEHHGDATPGSTAMVKVTGLDAFFDEIATRAYHGLNPDIQTLSWGQQLQVTDPFGNRIRFLEPTQS